MAVLLGAAVLISALVQGSSGLGFALILAPVVGLVDPTLLPVVLLVLLIPLNAFVVIRERHALDTSGLSWITAGRVAGAGAGLWLLVAVSAPHLRLLIGAVTALAAMVTLCAPAFAPNRPGYLTAGILAGIAETATGIGGPPLALVYQHRPASVLRATVAVCGLIGEVISLAVLAAAGHASGHQLQVALLLLTPMAVGALLSNVTRQRVRGPLVRVIVLSFAVVSGLILIVRG